jgi:hypothetical protein
MRLLNLFFKYCIINLLFYPFLYVNDKYISKKVIFDFSFILNFSINSSKEEIVKFFDSLKRANIDDE